MEPSRDPELLPNMNTAYFLQFVHVFFYPYSFTIVTVWNFFSQVYKSCLFFKVEFKCSFLPKSPQLG